MSPEEAFEALGTERHDEAVRVLRDEFDRLRAIEQRAQETTTAVGPIMRRTATYIGTGVWPDVKPRSPFGAGGGR
jgi:hypothetical protein